jgi:hypothetical protein
MTEANTDQGTPVVVTTEHKGVFFGFLAPGADPAAKTVQITDAQMCVYWNSDVQGVVGLAATGPTRGSKVSRPAPRITLQAVTAVIDATPEAVSAWRGRPWS